MWAGATLPAPVVAAGVVGAGVVAVGRRDRRAAGAVVLLVLGLHAASRVSDGGSPLHPGPVVLIGTAVGDPGGAVGETWVVVQPDEVARDGEWVPVAGVAHVLVRGSIPADVAAGEPVLVVGTGREARFAMRSGSVGGVIDARRVDRLGEAANALFRVGNRLRSQVLGGLRSVEHRPEGALLSGFLIGDVRRLPATDVEALRLAGLSHFVAVSGSNVALFLLAWWLVTAPLAWGPRVRAAIGLIGLALFVVVTRWEPSVVRAAGMAGVVLMGKLAGVPVRPWTALGVAIALLIAFDGGIVGSAGFQLSVAATAGILLAAPLVSGGRWVTVTLVATVAAQAAVAPLLLHHFGSVPLLAPLTNLAAAPLVAASTIVGGIGAVAHVGALVAVGVWIAGVVLAIARGAAGLPQLTTAAVIGLFGAAFAAVRVRALRPPAAVAAAVLVLSTLVPAGPPDAPTVVFLDVGQGDAALLLGPSGEVILIDGGPEPAILREHLRNRSIARIDLLVVSHRHADHVAGLDGITGTMPVGRLWYPPQLGEGSVLDSLVDQARAAGTVVETPGEGTMARIGAFSIEVLAPLRRYVSPNDGSIVLRVQAAGASIIFSGDIEAIAQGELGPLPADILKVPHQGSATSDLDWIRDSAPRVAVISVGPNDFGHPSEEVVEALRLAGADVRRTDQDGSIVLRLDQVAALPSAP